MSIGAVNSIDDQQRKRGIIEANSRSVRVVGRHQTLCGWEVDASYPHSGMHFALIHFLSFKFQQI